MADDFHGHNNAALLSLLANGAQTNADFDFGKINKSYWEGLDQNFKNNFRDKLAAGLPKIPGTDQVDWGQVAPLFAGGGQLSDAINAGKLGIEQQDRRSVPADARFISTGQEGAPPPQPRPQPYTGANLGPLQPKPDFPSSLNRSGMAVVAAPLNKGGVVRGSTGPTSVGGAEVAGGSGVVTPKQFLDQLGIPAGYNTEVGLAAFKRKGIDPDQTFDPNDPQIVKMMGPDMKYLKTNLMKVGQVQPPQSGDNPPQGQPQPQVAQGPPQGVPPQAAQAPPQSGPQLVRAPLQQSPSPFQNAIDQGLIPQEARAAPELYYAGLQRRAAESQNPSVREAASKTADAIRKSMELTASQRDLAASQRTPGLDEHVASQAGDLASAKGVAEADVKEQNDLIAAGQTARAKLGTINTMLNIVQSSKNLNLGFGSETSLKIKMALESAGIPTGDLSGAQLLQKYNSILASESTKGVTSRGTNFDMRTFMANNPGLAMDEKGNIRMLGIMAQNAKREAEIGKMARSNRGNWEKWDDVVQKYDETHPIKDPTTGNVLSNHSIIAPAPSKAKGPATPVSGSAQAAPASPTISSKADYDKLPPGATFTGPDGKPWQKPK